MLEHRSRLSVKTESPHLTVEDRPRFVERHSLKGSTNIERLEAGPLGGIPDLDGVVL